MKPVIIGAVIGAVVGVLMMAAAFLDWRFTMYAFWTVLCVGLFTIGGAAFGAAFRSARQYREKYGRSVWETWLG